MIDESLSSSLLHFSSSLRSLDVPSEENFSEIDEQRAIKEQAKVIGRIARTNVETVSIEVKMQAETREDIKALATATGFSTQEYIKRLIVNDLKNNPELVAAGKKHLKRFNGNITAARLSVQEELLSRLEAIQASLRGSDSDTDNISSAQQ